MTTDEYDDTTPLEYLITGLVILLFGLLYFLLNSDRREWSDVTDQAAVVAPALEKTDLGLYPALGLAAVPQTNPIKSAPESKPDVTADNATIAKMQAEQATLAADTNARLDDVTAALEQAKQEGLQAQEIIHQQGELERLQAEMITRQQQEIERLKATVAEREQELNQAERHAETLALAAQQEEKPLITPVITNNTNRLVFGLPDGSNVIVPDKGFEGALKEAMVRRRLHDPLHFDAIQFESGSARLSRVSNDQIKAVAALMNTYRDIRILIRGHTDNTGDVNTNSVLSLTRSVSMKEALTGLGIEPQRIKIEGVGQLEPIASNDTPEGRKQNRRIELILIE